MSHREKQDEALRQYKAKWGLIGYRFYIGYRGLEAFTEGTHISSHSPTHEIRNLSTLINRMNQGIWLHEGQNSTWFESKDEFLHYTLLRKLVGV
jgi:hypothetical protein